MVDQGNNPRSVRKLTCLCAPTTHAGSFRCRFHRASDNHWLIPHGPPLQPSSPSSPKPSAKPSSEYHGSEKPAPVFVDLKPPVVTKPLCGVVTRPSRLSNMVASSVGVVQKPSAKAATSTFNSSKIGFESNQQRHSEIVSASPPTPPRKAGVFAAGNCQSMMRKMHSESPPPIFSL